MHSIGQILFALAQIYLVVLFARAIFSWFPPPAANSPFDHVRRISFTLTEPVLGPFRRLIPPIGGLDISFLVAFIAIEIIASEVFRRL